MARGIEEIRENELLKRQVQTFHRVSQFVSSIYRLDQLLDLIMREAEAAVDAEASCIALYNESDHKLHIEFASGEADERVKDLDFELGQGILGTVADTRLPLLVSDLAEDRRFDASIDRQTGFTTKSILAYPILRRDELLGVLEVINKKGRPSFTETDTRLLEVVATQAAVAIENAKLFGQIVQEERLSVLGRMAASIIHDLKQPMNVIRGFAELLGKPEVDHEHRRIFSNLILEDVDRFLEMTEELLEYSQGSIAVQPQEVQVGDWLDVLATSLRVSLAETGVELVTRFDYIGPVPIDPGRMRRALINLAANASDAMPDGGTLTISSRLGGGYWELELSDTGSVYTFGPKAPHF